MEKITVDLSIKKELNITFNDYGVCECVAEVQFKCENEYPKTSPKEFSHKLGVTERTVHRAFDKLEMMNYLQANPKKKGQRKLIGKAAELFIANPKITKQII